MTVTIIDTSATSEQDHGHQGFPLYDPYYLPHQRPSRCATPRTTHHSALRAFRFVHYVDLSVATFSLSRLCPSLIANGYERTYWATTVHGTFLLRSVSFI